MMTVAELVFGALVAVTALALWIYAVNYLDRSSRRGVEIWEDEEELP